MLLYFADQLVGEVKEIVTPKTYTSFRVFPKETNRFPDDATDASNNRNSTLVINDQVKTMCSTMHKCCSGLYIANASLNSSHMTCHC